MPVFNNALAGAAGSGGADAYEIERSLRFNSGDSAYLNRTPSSTGNRRTFTFAFWIKKVTTSTAKRIFNCGPYTAGTGYRSFNLTSNGGTPDPFYMWDYSNGYKINLVADAAHRDDSAWYHLVWAVDTTQATESDRVKLYINGTQFTNWQTAGAGAVYPAQNYETGLGLAEEMRIGTRESKTSEFLDGYLADFYYIDGSALDATSFGAFDDNGVWQAAAYSGTFGNNGFHLDFSDNSSNAALGTDSSGNSNTWTVNNISGPGGDVDYASMVTQQSNGGYYANYGPEKAFDGLLTTAPNTSASNNNGNITFTPSPSISFTTSVRAYWNNGNTSATYSYNGGTATSITANGWITLASGSGTFTSLNTHRDGDGQYFSAIEVDGTTLLTSTGADNDSLLDSPTNYEADSGNNGGNYCTFNPLRNGATLSNGNLDVSSSSNGVNSFGTFGVSSGKWYWEVTINSMVNYYYPGIGVNTDLSQPNNLQSGGANDPDGYMYLASGQTFNNDDTSSYGSSYGAGDVIGAALDMDAGTITFYKNGVSQGQAFSSITGTAVPVVISYTGSACSANFGQRPFSISSVPTGYKSLCTQNLPDPLIADPSTAFDTALWTGNGSTQNITNLGFSPDLAWIKGRSFSGDHALFDTVRGATKRLRSNQTNTENTDTNTLTAFNSDGFSLGSSSAVNNNTQTFVGWAWDAGTSNSSISVGSLNSSVYDQSQTWSNSLSATFRSGEPATNAFDGDTSTIAGSAGSITYTSPVAVASNSTIRVFVHGGDHNVSVNSGANQTVAAGSFVTLNFTNPNSNTFTITFDRVAGGADSGVRAIEIGGKLLVDNGVSVTNVPTIASTVRANQTAGFSIVSYTGNSTSGATVGHGLNAKPEMIILKSRTSGENWFVNYPFGTGDGYLMLNQTNAGDGSNSTVWNSTDPTSSLFTLGNSNGVNGGQNYIAYCFAPVEGYSAFGSFQGNANANGTFVYTGFRPAFVMIKSNHNYDGGGTIVNGYNWFMYDSKRSAYNLTDDILAANKNFIEESNAGVDFLSNGFKMRNVNAPNANYAQYYIAFAENPFKYSRAR